MFQRGDSELQESEFHYQGCPQDGGKQIRVKSHDMLAYAHWAQRKCACARECGCFLVRTCVPCVYGKGVTVWDVSGKEKIVRPEIIQQSHCKTEFPPKWWLWSHYYQSKDIFIFVVDSNDRERMEECREELARFMSEDELQDCLANKQCPLMRSQRNWNSTNYHQTEHGMSYSSCRLL